MRKFDAPGHQFSRPEKEKQYCFLTLSEILVQNNKCFYLHVPSNMVAKYLIFLLDEIFCPSYCLFEWKIECSIN